MVDQSTLLSYPLITAGIIACIQLAKEYIPQVSGAATIVLAIILGLTAGLLHLEGINVPTGILLGLTSVGTFQVSQNIGGITKLP
jgi:hypothetical protein